MPPASCDRACFSSARLPASMTPRTASAHSIELAGQEAAQGELGPRRPRSSRQQGGNQQLDQRRTGQDMQLGHILAGDGMKRRPQVEVGRQRDGIPSRRSALPSGGSGDGLGRGEQRSESPAGPGRSGGQWRGRPGRAPETRATMGSCRSVMTFSEPPPGPLPEAERGERQITSFSFSPSPLRGAGGRGWTQAQWRGGTRRATGGLEGLAAAPASCPDERFNHDGRNNSPTSTPSSAR